MAQNISVPDIGDFKDVEVIEVLVKPGDQINKNDPIVTIESDKSSLEIPSPATGEIKSLKVQIGDKVSEGTVLATIENGKLSALYLKHSIDYKFFQYRTEILSSILPYSKWDFSKIAITSTYKQTKAFSTENIVRLLTGTTHGGLRARLFLGKIWTDELGVPQQISLKAAGNQSSLKYEKSYLRDSDSFFGYENFNDSYHLTSDGNIRGFTNYDNIKSDALFSVTSEIYFLNKKVDARGFFEDRYIDFELAFFSDSGVIYNRGNARRLSDFGIGVRLSSRVFNKPLHLRIDFPILMIDDGKKINDNKFIFSFERSI